MLLRRGCQPDCFKKRIQAAVRVMAVQMGRRCWLGTAVQGRLEVMGRLVQGPKWREEGPGPRLPGCESSPTSCVTLRASVFSCRVGITTLPAS